MVLLFSVGCRPVKPVPRNLSYCQLITSAAVTVRAVFSVLKRVVSGYAVEEVETARVEQARASPQEAPGEGTGNKGSSTRFREVHHVWLPSSTGHGVFVPAGAAFAALALVETNKMQARFRQRTPTTAEGVLGPDFFAVFSVAKRETAGMPFNQKR